MRMAIAVAREGEMASTSGPAKPGSGRRRRPAPPTIDLTATVVPDQAAPHGPAEPEAPDHPGVVPWLHQRPLLLGGIAAAAMLLIVAVLAMRSSPAPDTALADRLAAVEVRLGDLANRPAPAADTAPVAALGARLAA